MSIDYTMFFKVQRVSTRGDTTYHTVIHRYTLPKEQQTLEPYLTQSNVRAVKALVLAREFNLWAGDYKRRRPEEHSIAYIGAAHGHQPLERLE